MISNQMDDSKPPSSQSTKKEPAPSVVSGLVLLNKQAGMTSFKAISAVKRAMGTKKVGHTGTLDLFATGLLVVLVGKMTKLASYIEAQEKVYIATAQFGIQTDTLDPEGEVVAKAPIPSLSEIEAVLPQFIGNILQTPPAYSAIKINGKRASDRLRAGERLELKSRPITIFSLEILNYSPNGILQFRVKCSKGSYIRSLARDIALACESCAHLIALERQQVGPYNLYDASEPLALTKEKLIKPNDIFQSLPQIHQHSVKKEQLSQIQNGTPIHLLPFAQELPQGMSALFYNEEFLALVEKKENTFQYLMNGGQP